MVRSSLLETFGGTQLLSDAYEMKKNGEVVETAEKYFAFTADNLGQVRVAVEEGAPQAVLTKYIEEIGRLELELLWVHQHHNRINIPLLEKVLN